MDIYQISHELATKAIEAYVEIYWITFYQSLLHDLFFSITFLGVMLGLIRGAYKCIEAENK